MASTASFMFSPFFPYSPRLSQTQIHEVRNVYFGRTLLFSKAVNSVKSKIWKIEVNMVLMIPEEEPSCAEPSRPPPVRISSMPSVGVCGFFLK